MSVALRLSPLIALLSLTACSPQDPPGAPTTAATADPAPASAPAPAPTIAAPADAYSCSNPGEGRCTQYTADSPALKDAANGVEGMRRVCELQGGSWQTATCTTDGALGTCGKPATTIVCFDEKCASAYAKSCTLTGGTWTPAG